MVAAGVLLLGAAPAAAGIQTGPVQTVPGTTYLHGIACSDASDCLVVGEGSPPTGVIYGPSAIVPVSAGVAGAAENVAGPFALYGIGCVFLGDCLAAGVATPDDGTTFEGAFVPVTGGQPGAAQAVSGTGFNGVACPAAGECLAVGSSSVVSVTNGSPGPPQNVDGTQNLDAVACGAATTCFAVGNNRASNGVVVPIDAGTAGGPLTPLATVLSLSAIACASATDCFAVGRDFLGDGVVVPITNGAVGTVQDVAGSTNLTGIACPNATTCVAVGYIQGTGSVLSGSVVVPITSGVAGSAQQVAGVDSTSFGSIACQTSSECLAVGFTTTPGVSGAIGAVTQVLVGAALGQPSPAIGEPAGGQSYVLNDPSSPMYSFSCRAAFGGALASSGGCVATINGNVVTNGQPIDTSQTGTFTLTVIATQADGQQTSSTSTFIVTKGGDSIYFPQLGPFPYRHAAVELDAISFSRAQVFYSVVSGPCAVSGSTLAFTGSGRCVVSAEQPGTTNYYSASATSTIWVDRPTPPRCSSAGVDVPRGYVAKISLGCTDAESDQGDPLTLAVTSLPRHGTLTALHGSTGRITYTPAGGYGGSDSFAFDATNAQGVSAPAAISIRVMRAPARVDRPAVSGTPAVGRELKCSTGTWSGTRPLKYTYRWQRGEGLVPRRARARYRVGPADAGHSLRCIVTAKNPVGSARARSAPVHILRMRTR